MRGALRAIAGTLWVLEPASLGCWRSAFCSFWRGQNVSFLKTVLGSCCHACQPESVSVQGASELSHKREMPKVAPKGTKHQPSSVPPLSATPPAHILPPSDAPPPPLRHARRSRPSASAGATWRSHHRSAETPLQRQLPQAHYTSSVGATSARAGQLAPQAALRVGWWVATTITTLK